VIQFTFRRADSGNRQCLSLCELGITGDVQHESYLAGWLKALREDKKAIFRACRFAREASEFLLQPLNRQPEQAA
jgi:antirestriction protein ArdC